MERVYAVAARRAFEEAEEQAEILLSALRGGREPDVGFLVAHAQHLLACCREIAEARAR